MKAVLMLLAVFLLTACGSSRREPTPTPSKTSAPVIAMVEVPATQTPIPAVPVLVATAKPMAESATPTVPPPIVELVPTAANAEPIPTATLPQPAALPQTTANDVANLRGGPGTDFPIVGSVTAGQVLTIIGRNAVGDWYQLVDGNWIAAFLVSGAPGNVAVVDVVVNQPVEVAPNAPVVEQPTVAPVLPTAAPFTCAGGCATPPDASCDIKGNINSSNDKIYHTTDSRSYANTNVRPEEGDRWFCTTQEAQAAGFRAPQN